MDVTYINPFIESVQETFSTMIRSDALRGELGLTNGLGNDRGISVLIGLSGSARGTVALHLPERTATRAVNRLLGTTFSTVDEDVVDGVAELLNIIAGSAKAKLATSEKPPIDLGLPSVIKGVGHSVDYPKCSTWLEVPFESDIGPFSLKVTFEKSPENGRIE